MSTVPAGTEDASVHLWSIVLAGGEGTRTQEFIRRELGVDRPKQYCSFVGRRSLLQHTVDRADRISRPEHRVVVVSRRHRRHVLLQMEGRSQGILLFQPANRGTAPGVFLPLTYVLKRAPDATVAIYPSDHFVYPESTFNRAVAEAVALADQHEDRVVLLGVSPSGPQTEYGWIEPGRPLPGTSDDRARAVSRFIEKPSKDTAVSAFRNGALWNTAILVGKLQSFWRLGWRHLPQMMVPFVELWCCLGTDDESAVLERIYRTLPTLDFSRDLLQAATANLVVSKLSNVLWSDWGSPARIRETLEVIGARERASEALETLRLTVEEA